jgi:hypothetical protein
MIIKSVKFAVFSTHLHGLECRKLYTDVLRKENFLDPSVYEQWYTTHGGLHHVYVAEITSAWIKD